MTQGETEVDNALSGAASLTLGADKVNDGNSPERTKVEGEDDAANQGKDKLETAQRATEQSIDPWSVEAATDEQGNTLEFDYLQISKYVTRERRALSPVWR